MTSRVKYGIELDPEDPQVNNPTTESLSYREKQLRNLFKQDALEQQREDVNISSKIKGTALDKAYQESLNSEHKNIFTNFNYNRYLENGGKNNRSPKPKSPLYKQPQIKITDNVDYKELIYASMLRYFGDLLMTKIRDEGKVSVYAAKISSNYTKEQRYVIAFSHGYEPRRNLSDLKWVSFHTRTLNLAIKLANNDYPRTIDRVTNAEILILDPNSDKEKGATYRCREFPVEIKLLPYKESYKDYPNKGIISAALETFNCSLSFK